MMKKTFLQRRQIVYPAALVLAAICLLIGLRSCGKEQPADATGIEFMMDTVVEQCWYGEDAEEAYQRVSRVLHQMEQELSPYLEESEIAQLNAAAGHGTVQLSDETYELLKRSVSLCEQTGGLFDITIKPLVDLWDVTGESPVVPTDSQITEKKTTGWLPADYFERRTKDSNAFQRGDGCGSGRHSERRRCRSCPGGGQ